MLTKIFLVFIAVVTVPTIAIGLLILKLSEWVRDTINTLLQRRDRAEHARWFDREIAKLENGRAQRAADAIVAVFRQLAVSRQLNPESSLNEQIDQVTWDQLQRDLESTERRRHLAVSGQDWMIDTRNKIALVFERSLHLHRTFEITSWGIVGDIRGQVTVNVTLLFPMHPTAVERSELRRQSYFVLHNPENLSLHNGVIEFAVPEPVRLPEMRKLLDDPLLELRQQCRSCKFVHWRRYGVESKLLVCANHPEGKLDCVDFEAKEYYKVSLSL